MHRKELIEKAKEAMKMSYSPYSNFPVGAALLTAKGNVYLGCNIENASYGASNCAERTAIFNAISKGERDIMAIAIVSNLKSYTYPCGICLQVMQEHMPKGEVILINKEDKIKTLKLEKLLPYGFTKDKLNENY